VKASNEAALLAAYSTGLIRASSGFRRGVVAATGGICIVYLVSMVLGFFGIQIPGTPFALAGVLLLAACAIAWRVTKAA